MGPYKPLRTWVAEFIPYYMEIRWNKGSWSTLAHVQKQGNNIQQPAQDIFPQNKNAPLTIEITKIKWSKINNPFFFDSPEAADATSHTADHLDLGFGTPWKLMAIHDLTWQRLSIESWFPKSLRMETFRWKSPFQSIHPCSKLVGCWLSGTRQDVYRMFEGCPTNAAQKSFRKLQTFEIFHRFGGIFGHEKNLALRYGFHEILVV